MRFQFRIPNSEITDSGNLKVPFRITNHGHAFMQGDAFMRLYNMSMADGPETRHPKPETLYPKPSFVIPAKAGTLYLIFYHI
jgi:hypothetical protein